MDKFELKMKMNLYYKSQTNVHKLNRKNIISIVKIL